MDLHESITYVQIGTEELLSENYTFVPDYVTTDFEMIVILKKRIYIDWLMIFIAVK